MSRIRPFRTGDEPALAEICLRTAASGADATGVLDDDAIWAEIFVLPYVARHPESAFVVETDDERVAGYIVCAPDTRAFEDWFATEWWPEHGARWPRREPGSSPQQESQQESQQAPQQGSRQDDILRYADGRRAGAEPYGDEYPAHLHIDLLPELQGQGWGRRLVDTLAAALRDRGVTGLHLVAGADNTGALAFYDRLGFARLPSHEGVQAFGMRLG